MENKNDAVVYYVDDIEDDQSDASSIDTTMSGFTDNSMSTLMSDEASEYFQEIHGRTFPLAQHSPLIFPADQLEVQRLDLQHVAIKLLLNGHYFGPVKEVLLETSERRKRVLDLLTAEGNWVREMAAEFPHVEFKSVDTIPLVPHTRLPNVIGYEVYDLHSGILEEDESFDVVHIRHVVSKTWDLSTLILEIHRVLRPGGLLLWSDYEAGARDASSAEHDTAEKSPNLARATQLMKSACIRQGAPLYAWRDVPLLLDPQSEIWRKEGAGKRTRGFTSIQKEVKMFPLVPWHPSPRLRDVGVLIKRPFAEMWAGFQPAFINEGLSESEANELTLQARREILECGTKQLYINYHVLYAFKSS